MRMAAVFKADGKHGNPFILDLEVPEHEAINARLRVEQAVEKYLFEMHNRSVREAVEKEELSRAALDFNDGCETDTFELEFYWDYTGYPDLNGDLCVLIKTPLLADQLLVGFAPEDRDKLIGI
jgi:hypothetical protein